MTLLGRLPSSSLSQERKIKVNRISKLKNIFREKEDKMHIMIGFTKIIYSRYQTKITLKEFDFFSRLKYSKDICLERTPNGFYVFQTVFLLTLKIAHEYIGMCVCVCVCTSCVCRFN